jgi:hypothetical protein
MPRIVPIVFFALITSVFAGEGLEALANAASSFSAAIEGQLAVIRRDPAAAEFAKTTVLYAEAKTAYFKALRDEMPELLDIVEGREATPPELEKFTQAFSETGEEEEIVDKETIALLKRFVGNPDVEKARAEFESAEKLEEAFYRDFDGKEFAIR